jgi:hypothetical protein
MLRFNDHLQVKRFSIDWIDYRCKVVPSIPATPSAPAAAPSSGSPRRPAAETPAQHR